MLRPPPVSMLLKLPVTGGTVIVAGIVTAIWFMGRDISILMMTPGWWPARPWVLLTSALPHVGVLHLVFNVYWVWIFGSALELRLGHVRTLTIFLLLALVSATAEYAFMSGGVGLSGVGYGLFAFLWVMSGRNGWFPGAVDMKTITLFVTWFFFCIVLTVTDVMPVANIAHGAGAAVGALLAMAAKTQPARRKPWIAGIATLALITGLLATVAWPCLNYSHAVLASAGYEALAANRNADARTFCRRAATLDPQDAGNWQNLGIACQRLGCAQEAEDAYAQADRLRPRHRE